MNTIKYSVVRSTIASIKSINNSKNLNSFMIYRHTFSTQPDETKISNKKNEKKSDKKMKSEKSENEDLLTFFETAMKISE